MMRETESKKRAADAVENDSGDAAVEDEEDDWIGPLPSEAAPVKKRKVLEFEQVYLDAMPSSDSYERSYMHKESIAFIHMTKNEFLITASVDGHLKFWKKLERGIEFVKHFRVHLGNIQDIGVNSTGLLLASISNDKSMKVFDVINFDMINMVKLGYTPLCCEWIHTTAEAVATIAVADADSKRILIYDGRGTGTPLKILETLHQKPVVLMKYNPVYDTVISVDKGGMLEYWQGSTKDYRFPSGVVDFEFKTDTDLYEFAKAKCVPTGVDISKDGKLIATIATDRKVRIFRFLTGKLKQVFDESLKQFTDYMKTSNVTSLEKERKLLGRKMNSAELDRRLAVDRELEKSDSFGHANIIFDESGNFVIYATLIGVKIVNLTTNAVVRTLGKSESMRFLNLAIFQGRVRTIKAATTIEAQASDNPALDVAEADPTLFCTAYKNKRFFMFSTREPMSSTEEDTDRDIFNEKPTKEEALTAVEPKGEKRISSSVVIHTTVGDIHVQLFPKECPRTIENFCVHARSNYYNGHIFHRVIKSFMVQTGDPKGDGTGGESIWGGEFEDEFHPTLKHDRPYTLSMANAGPNTNGSQFFITVIPAPWLDNKHTVFGRVTRGMEIIQKISLAKTHPKTDKPYDDISIINIAVK